MNLATEHDQQLGTWIAAAALGAMAMYLLDPERGAARRAQSGRALRDLGRQGGAVLGKVAGEVGARVDGAGAAVRSAASQAGSAIQEAVDHAGGAASAALSSAASSAPAPLPDGQSGAPLHALHGGHVAAPARWGGGRRGAAIAGGGALGLAGLLLARPSLRLVLGLAGLALMARGAANRPLYSWLRSGANGHAVEVEKTIRIDATPEQLYDLFANYDNFPRFMSNVVEVRDLGGRRSHWVVKGPAGSEFTWNAVLTEQTRPHKLAWQSEPGAEVAQAGAIRFEPFRNGTRVTVRLSYRPPAGKVGQALAALLGSDPKRQMEHDLARMKALVERGVITHHGAAPAAGESKFLH